MNNRINSAQENYRVPRFLYGASLQVAIAVCLIKDIINKKKSVNMDSKFKING